MSKSFGNYIGITDTPQDMFGKLMSLRDDLLPKYFELATRLPNNEVSQITEALQSNELQPMEAKKRLAWEVVALYHGKEEADKAQKEFEEVFQKGGVPENVKTYNAKSKMVDLIDVLLETQLVTSKSEVRRLLEQGGLEWNGKKVTSLQLTVEAGGTLRIGKHRFLRIEAM